MSTHQAPNRFEEDYFAPAKWNPKTPRVYHQNSVRWDIILLVLAVIAVGASIYYRYPGFWKGLSSRTSIATSDAPVQSEETDSSTGFPNESDQSAQVVTDSKESEPFWVHLNVPVEHMPKLGETIVCMATISGDASGVEFVWESDLTHTVAVTGDSIVLGPFVEEDRSVPLGYVRVEARNAAGEYDDDEFSGINVQPVLDFRLSDSSVMVSHMNPEEVVSVVVRSPSDVSPEELAVVWLNEDGVVIHEGPDLIVRFSEFGTSRATIACEASYGGDSDTVYLKINSERQSMF